MICADVDMLVHPYLDGELVGEERVLVEDHVSTCARCRDLVGHESTFKAHLRARLRPRNARDFRSGSPVPAGLELRLREALDHADKTDAGPASPILRWTAPSLGALAVAAAVAIFAGMGGGGRRLPRGGGDDFVIVDAAIDGHRKNLPVEIGGTVEDVSSWMRGKIPVPVRPPNLRATFVGARYSHLASRDAGQLLYRVGRSQLTVFIFDASSDWDVPGQGARRLTTGGHEVYLVERAGYSVVLYRDRGVGYALASDLDEDALLALASASLGN